MCWISVDQLLAVVWRDKGLLTILCVLVGWLIVVDFLVMFFLSKDDTPAETPAT